MLRILLIIIFIIGTHYASFAQREHLNWYFGDRAGLRFNGDNSLSSLTDGDLTTIEGSAVISDRFGNLLFYTNGSVVWDRTHNIMSGGERLLGSSLSTQSSIIVPQPNSRNIHYLFTTDVVLGTLGNNPFSNGLNFYKIDLSIGENGTVVERGNNEQPLLPFTAEKITATRAGDCESIWVITHFEDSFYAYKVTADGVETTPVISKTPTLVPFEGFPSNAEGSVKIAPDGSRLAIAHTTITRNNSELAQGRLLFYDFDIETGIVSNEQNLPLNGLLPYGVEFSPNSKVLYASVSFPPFTGGSDVPTPPLDSSIIFQYDLTSNNVNDSRNQIGITLSRAGSLQLAPDGRIYYSVGVLHIIDNPDVLRENAGFRINSVPLSGSSSIGLPNFVQSFFRETADITNLLNPDGSPALDVFICENDSFTFIAPEFPGATYTWFYDNGTIEVPFPCDTRECTLINAQIEDAGLYRVEIDKMDGECPLDGFAFVTVNPLPDVIDSSLFQCDLDENPLDGNTLFNLTEIESEIIAMNTDSELDFEYFENELSLNNNNPIISPEEYRNTIPFNQIIFIRVTNQNGCSNIAQIALIVQAATLDLPSVGPFFTCDNDMEDGLTQGVFNLLEILENNFSSAFKSSLFRSLDDAVLERNPILQTAAFLTESTTIFIRFEENNQCLGIEQFDLIVDPLPEFEFQDSFLLCLNEGLLDVSAPAGFDFYNWFFINPDGSETLVFFEFQDPDFTILDIGNYRLEIGTIFNDFGVERSCFSSQTFEVLPSNIATITDIDVQDITGGNSTNSIIIDVSGEGDYEFALDNIEGPYQSSNILNNVPPGLVTVFVRDRNGCGIVQTEVLVIGFPNFFTPNGDGINERWQIIGLKGILQLNTTIFIFNRFGQLLAQIDPSGEGWDGTFNGQELPSTDYWFRVKLEDGRDFTGHFALKR